mgnify:CR=1 FL=1
MRKNINRGLAGLVGAASLMQGCEAMTPEEKRMADERLLGYTLGAWGAQEGNAAAYFTGKGLVDGTNAERGASQININSVPQQNNTQVSQSQSNYYNRGAKVIFFGWDDLNNDGLIDGPPEMNIKRVFDRSETVYMACETGNYADRDMSIVVERIEPERSIVFESPRHKIPSDQFSIFNCPKDSLSQGRYLVTWRLKKYANDEEVKIALQEAKKEFEKTNSSGVKAPPVAIATATVLAQSEFDVK